MEGRPPAARWSEADVAAVLQQRQAERAGYLGNALAGLRLLKDAVERHAPEWTETAKAASIAAELLKPVPAWQRHRRGTGRGGAGAPVLAAVAAGVAAAGRDRLLAVTAAGADLKTQAAALAMHRAAAETQWRATGAALAAERLALTQLLDTSFDWDARGEPPGPPAESVDVGRFDGWWRGVTPDGGGGATPTPTQPVNHIELAAQLRAAAPAAADRLSVMRSAVLRSVTARIRRETRHDRSSAGGDNTGGVTSISEWAIREASSPWVAEMRSLVMALADAAVDASTRHLSPAAARRDVAAWRAAAPGVRAAAARSLACAMASQAVTELVVAAASESLSCRVEAATFAASIIAHAVDGVATAREAGAGPAGRLPHARQGFSATYFVDAVSHHAGRSALVSVLHHMQTAREAVGGLHVGPAHTQALRGPGTRRPPAPTAIPPPPPGSRYPMEGPPPPWPSTSHEDVAWGERLFWGAITAAPLGGGDGCLPLLRGGVACMSPSPDGSMLAVGSTAGDVFVYSRTTVGGGAEVGGVGSGPGLPGLPGLTVIRQGGTGTDSALAALSWSADGGQVAGVADDGACHLWSMRPAARLLGVLMLTITAMVPRAAMPSSGRALGVRGAPPPAPYPPRPPLAYHPSFTASGLQPTVAVGWDNGDVVRLTLGASRVGPAIIWGDPGPGPRGLPSAVIAKLLPTELPPPDGVRATALHRGHESPIVHLGYVAASAAMVTVDAGGHVALWPPNDDAKTGLGWLCPARSWQLPTRMTTFAPVGDTPGAPPSPGVTPADATAEIESTSPWLVTHTPGGLRTVIRRPLGVHPHPTGAARALPSFLVTTESPGPGPDGDGFPHVVSARRQAMLSLACPVTYVTAVDTHGGHELLLVGRVGAPPGQPPPSCYPHFVVLTLRPRAGGAGLHGAPPTMGPMASSIPGGPPPPPRVDIADPSGGLLPPAIMVLPPLPGFGALSGRGVESFLVAASGGGQLSIYSRVTGLYVGDITLPPLRPGVAITSLVIMRPVRPGGGALIAIAASSGTPSLRVIELETAQARVAAAAARDDARRTTASDSGSGPLLADGSDDAASEPAISGGEADGTLPRRHWAAGDAAQALYSDGQWYDCVVKEVAPSGYAILYDDFPESWEHVDEGALRPRQWRVGHPVDALFGPQGAWFPATVQGTRDRGATVTIVFDGYVGEETVPRAHVRPRDTAAAEMPSDGSSGTPPPLPPARTAQRGRAHAANGLGAVRASS